MILESEYENYIIIYFKLFNMWNKNLVAIMTLSLFIILNILISYHYASAQANETGNNGTSNITSPVFTPNNNFTSGTSSNTTGIMENTSGMIDDAFDALKDSFRSFFGK
jgi:hypothetical protein